MCRQRQGTRVVPGLDWIGLVLIIAVVIVTAVFAALVTAAAGAGGFLAALLAAAAVTVPVTYKKFTDQNELGHFLVEHYKIRTPRELTSCEVCHR